jgi:hypothetical protein
MAQHIVTRVQDPAPVKKINDIPTVNWRRYPSKPITGAMLVKTDAAAKVTTYIPGAAYQGAAADNNGETGTATTTGASRGQAWNTQNEKAAALGTTMAQDVGKSYQAGTRGKIENYEPYPNAAGARPYRAPAYRTTQESSWDLS